MIPLASSATIYSNTCNAVVTILSSAGTSYAIGQGFWIQGPDSNFGYIATAAHVITDSTLNNNPISTNIWVHTTYPTNNIYKINGTTNVVMGRDRLSDVALLRITGTGFPALTYANSRTDIKPGDNVTIIGYPLGFDPQSVARGVIRDNKGVPDTYFSGVGGGFMESVLTDCSIYGGNSGGPMINDDGKWIGILSWGVGSDGAMNGGVASYLANQIFTYYFNNYSNTVVNFPKGYLGISATPMDILLSVSKQLNNVQGYLVSALDSTIKPAKFAVGDIITSINGTEIGILNNQMPLFSIIQLATPGTSLTIQYRPANNLATILTKTVVVSPFPASKDTIFNGYRSQQKNKRMGNTQGVLV
jgi:S1-C subfamily serine protease